MNQLLSGWKKAGVNSVEGAKKASTPTTRTETYTEREYTDDELQSIFGDIENFDNLGI